jgi:hypothetical protein
MHSIHTFILRLFYDTHDPETLRGSLCVVGEKEIYTFVGDKNLCALAARLIQDQEAAAATAPVKQTASREVGGDDL